MLPEPLVFRALGREIRLRPVADRLALRFAETTPAADRAVVATELDLAGPSGSFAVPGEKLTIFRVPATAPLADTTATIGIARAATARPDVDRVAPVFAFGGYRVVAAERLVVGVRPGRAEARLIDLGLVVLERFAGGLLLQVPPGVDPETLIGRVAAVPDVTFAEPDLVVIGRNPRTTAVIDARNATAPPLGIGYAAVVTGLVASRRTAHGDAAVRIAVLDDGIDLTHPDLRAVVHGGYDATADRPDVAPDAWNEHGTACAGLAAGAGQVSGFGNGCTLLAVRIARSVAPNTPWVTATSYLRRGIDWAAERADVLSLSWGGAVTSSAVAAAVARAGAGGRGGRGCVVVAAAGNSPGPVDFPASLPDVLAVSGTNALDEFKTPTSSDGETWWGSASGAQVDIAAPAVGIRTTGLRGPAGSTVDDYLPAFNGTSAATPMVAGAAALLLSVAPAAGAAQIRGWLTGTAAKVGDHPYVGGRNDRFGAGRLDVEQALRSAMAGRPPAGPVTGSSAGSTEVPPNEVRLPLPDRRPPPTAVPPALQVHLGDPDPPAPPPAPQAPGRSARAAPDGPRPADPATDRENH